MSNVFEGYSEKNKAPWLSKDSNRMFLAWNFSAAAHGKDKL